MIHSSLLVMGVLLLLVARAAAQSTQPVNARFAMVDITIDTGSTKLAAYQVEIESDPKRVQLVGVEGSDHAAYRDAPYYDAKALSGSRIIIAALSTGQNLPAGRVRVARLHVRISGDGPAQFTSSNVVVADPQRKPIPAKVSVQEGSRP